MLTNPPVNGGEAQLGVVELFDTPYSKDALVHVSKSESTESTSKLAIFQVIKMRNKKKTSSRKLR